MLVMHLGVHSMNIFRNRITNYQVQEREEGESHIAQEFITRGGATYCLGIHYKRGSHILLWNSLQKGESHCQGIHYKRGSHILPRTSLQEGEPHIVREFTTTGGTTLPGNSLRERESFCPGVHCKRGSHIVRELIKNFC